MTTLDHLGTLKYLVYCPMASPLPCLAGPPAGLSRGSPNGFRRALVKPAPPSQRAKGLLRRGEGPIGPKVSRPLPQLFELPGPYPVDQHQQKKHRQSRPIRRTALIQAVKARDQTGGGHLQCNNGRTFTRVAPPALWVDLCTEYQREETPSSSRSKVEVEVEVRLSEVVKSTKHH